MVKEGWQEQKATICFTKMDLEGEHQDIGIWMITTEIISDIFF